MSEQEFSAITVGQPLPVFGEAYMGYDGAIFDTLGEGNGYILAIYLNKISFQERLWLETRKIEIRGIFEGPFCMLFFHVKGTSLIFEVNFSPTKREPNDVFQFHLEEVMYTQEPVGFSRTEVQWIRRYCD